MGLLHCLHCKNCLQENWALIRSMKLLSSVVAIFLYKCTKQLCMEYCCHVCACAHKCILDMLDKLQKRVCGTAGLSTGASWTLGYSIVITLIDIHLNWLRLSYFLILVGDQVVILTLPDFFVTLPLYVSSFFLCTE